MLSQRLRGDRMAQVAELAKNENGGGYSARTPRPTQLSVGYLMGDSDLSAIHGLEREHIPHSQRQARWLGVKRGSVACPCPHPGSADRKEYTVIGDAVNVAFRIESLNKEFGSTLLISESVTGRRHRRHGAHSILLRAIRGRQDPIELFHLLTELTGFSAAPPERFSF